MTHCGFDLCCCCDCVQCQSTIELVSDQRAIEAAKSSDEKGAAEAVTGIEQESLPKTLVNVYELRARVHIKQSRFAEGLDEIQKYLRVRGERPELYTLQARCHQGMGQQALAYEDFTKAIAVSALSRVATQLGCFLHSRDSHGGILLFARAVSVCSCGMLLRLTWVSTAISSSVQRRKKHTRLSRRHATAPT